MLQAVVCACQDERSETTEVWQNHSRVICSNLSTPGFLPVFKQQRFLTFKVLKTMLWLFVSPGTSYIILYLHQPVQWQSRFICLVSCDATMTFEH